MEYALLFTPYFEKQLKKLKKKDNILFDRVTKKIKEIKINPEHYKPLTNDLKGLRRVHFDPFVMVFEIHDTTITFHYVKHHDQAY